MVSSTVPSPAARCPPDWLTVCNRILAQFLREYWQLVYR